MPNKPTKRGQNSTRHPGAVDSVKGRAGRILAKGNKVATYETGHEAETAVLVAVPDKRQDDALTTEYLDELAFLTETAGTVPTKRFVQKLEKPDIRTFVGSGKLEEIRAYVQHHGTNTVIFDDDLSPSQLRNLEKELKVKILDRTLLILDIFALRAKTATARTQVELAQYQYLLPRLTGLWTHLERQRGGVGMRGPGEREIETDRRVVRDRISLLKEQPDPAQVAHRRDSRGAGGLYQRGQKHADEHPQPRRRVCRKQAFRYRRLHSAQGGAGERAVPALRYGRVYPEAAHAPDRKL
jgi:GTP-binding protein HflX